MDLFSSQDLLRENQEMIMHCRETGQEMYEVIEGRDDIYISSHGQCIECKEYKSIDALKTAEGMSPAKWPVRYVGYTCKDCWNNS